MPDLRRLAALLVIIVIVAIACSSGSGSGGGSGGSEACSDTCVALQDICPGSVDECQSDCKQPYSLFASCKSQLDAFFICAAGRPGSDFHCDATGQPQLNGGVCATEVDALRACNQ